MSHNVYLSDSGYATMCSAASCGTALWHTNKLGMDDLVVDGVTVNHDIMVRGVDGRKKWPVLVEGIARITVSQPATAGDKAWVNYETGKIDGDWFDGAIQCTNVTFLTGGTEPLFLIEKEELRIPLPDFYMPLVGSLDSYNMDQKL